MKKKLTLVEAMKEQKNEIIDEVMKSRDVEKTLVAVQLSAIINTLISHLENNVPKKYRG